MKKAVFLIVALLFTGQIIAQSSLEDFVKQGVEYHDKGDYDKAIEAYKKALTINPKSPLVNYELALSYFTKGDYAAAVKSADKVLKEGKEHIIQSYVVKGSALDMMGKSKESIKLFKKAIKKTEGHYLLYYNLALNHYKIDDLEKAEENAIKALALNFRHSSSHLMLASIHDQQSNTVQSLLATHYFLFLEPNSGRSLEAYKMLQKNFGGNVTKDENGTTININLPSSADDQFAVAELMVSMLQAAKSTEKNKDKTEEELFIENTTSFFKVLSDLKKKKNNEIWVTYTSFFKDLARSEHMPAYCHYISQSGNEKARDWLSKHKEELGAFDEWLRGE